MPTNTMIDDFLGIAIVGAGLSGIIEYIKLKMGIDSWATKILTIILAIVVGGLYVFLAGTPIWTTIIGVLAAATTVYAFILK